MDSGAGPKAGVESESSIRSKRAQGKDVVEIGEATAPVGLILSSV